MQLLIRRSQYEGFWGTIYYTLDATLEPTDDEAQLINRHGVASVVIFDSERRKQRMEAAHEHADATTQRPAVQTGSTEEIFFAVLQHSVGTLYDLGAAAYNLILGSLEARITIQNMLDGAHLESDEVGEILDAERIIGNAISFLQDRLSQLTTFDGTEDLYEIE